jgi:PhnB protein
MPIADDLLGSYFRMFADKFGVQWMADFTAKYNGKV